MNAKSYALRALLILNVLSTSSLRAQMQSQTYAPILDQSQTFHNDIERVGQDITIAQTFTPSISGYFSQLVLWAGRQNGSETTPFLISIADTQNGLPNNILGAVTQTSFIPSVRSWYTYDFSSQGIYLNAGIQYAIELTCPGSFNGIGVGASLADIYPAGREFERTSSTPWAYPNFPVTGNAGADLTFQTIMLPVPEPGVLALVVLGLSSLTLWRRAKHAAS